MKNILLLSLFLALFLLPLDFAVAAIDSDLQFGARGPKVIELQNFLIAKGFLSGRATGNFYSLTKQAVIVFQKSVGVSGTGYVGPLTRKKINELAAGGGVSQDTSLPSTNGNSKQTSMDFLVKQMPFFVTKNTWDF